MLPALNPFNETMMGGEGNTDLHFGMWNFQMLEKLVNHNLPIISGIYKKTPDIFACCGLDGRTLTTNDIEGQTDLIEVKANGMGFMLVKREVLDYIIDPFEPIDPDQWEDFTFQEKARQRGYKSYIDPTIIVGHEKKIVL
jgi:GT2 family glycosyltransferase